jgi:hypothetical protein
LQKGSFDFSGRDSMTGYVNNIINAPRDPIISVSVTRGTISCELKGGEISPHLSRAEAFRGTKTAWAQSIHNILYRRLNTSLYISDVIPILFVPYSARDA